MCSPAPPSELLFPPLTELSPLGFCIGWQMLSGNRMQPGMFGLELPLQWHSNVCLSPVQSILQSILMKCPAEDQEPSHPC